MKTTEEIDRWYKDEIYQTDSDRFCKARDTKWMSENDFRELYIMFSKWTNTTGSDKVVGRLAEEFFEKM